MAKNSQPDNKKARKEKKSTPPASDGKNEKDKKAKSGNANLVQ